MTFFYCLFRAGIDFDQWVSEKFNYKTKKIQSWELLSTTQTTTDLPALGTW